MVRRAVVVAAFVLSACSPAPSPSVEPSQVPTPTRTPVPTAAASISTSQWTEPTHYSFTLDSRCGERLLIGRFRVEVENGAVVSVEALDEQAQSVTAFITPEAVPTLAEILERVAEARRQNAYEVTLSTDPFDGHPTMVSIDWDFNTIDEEECYAISEYAPLPG